MRLEHPYGNLTGGTWWRGNLHTHSTRSDGQREPQAVIDAYLALGHQFLMFSDHDKFADAELLASYNAKGLVLIPGNEVSARGPHMLQVGGTSGVEPDAERQTVIDAVNAQGGFVIANHPNWFARFNHFPQEQLEALERYEGMEIFNGVIGRLDGSQFALDRWDMLLAKGRRIWGFVNDDSHKADGDTGLGWNVVYVTEPTADGVIAAMRQGRFYGSTGVVIDKIAVDGTRITIEAANANRIVATRNTDRRFAIADGPSLTVDVPEGADYVRFTCCGIGEQFAWTQPFFVHNEA